MDLQILLDCQLEVAQIVIDLEDLHHILIGINKATVNRILRIVGRKEDTDGADCDLEIYKLMMVFGVQLRVPTDPL